MESLSDVKIDRQPYSGLLVFQDVKFLRKIKIAISYRAFMMWPTIIFEKCPFLLIYGKSILQQEKYTYQTYVQN